jgi:hypothetical protein
VSDRIIIVMKMMLFDERSTGCLSGFLTEREQ